MRSAAAVSPRRRARLARRILTDGAGPLYVGNGNHDLLRDAALTALRNLDGDGGAR